MDARTKIKSHLESEGRKIKWLSSQLEVTPGHLSQVLAGERVLTKKHLSKIKELWPDADFSDTLPHEQLALNRESLKEKPLFKDQTGE